MLAVDAFGLELIEWGVIASALFVAAEISGLSRSGRTARRENNDLRELNATLEGEVKALSERASSLQRQVDDLTRQIDDLKARNVDNLWTSFSEHDRRVAESHTALGDSLEKLSESITLHEDQALARHLSMIAILELVVANAGGKGSQTS